jgi:hypothetical protein
LKARIKQSDLDDGGDIFQKTVMPITIVVGARNPAGLTCHWYDFEQAYMDFDYKIRT